MIVNIISFFSFDKQTKVKIKIYNGNNELLSAINIFQLVLYDPI